MKEHQEPTNKDNTKNKPNISGVFGGVSVIPVGFFGCRLCFLNGIITMIVYDKCYRLCRSCYESVNVPVIPSTLSVIPDSYFVLESRRLS